jgi:APA family basic amino acid/polyamine antiporter
MAGSIFRKKPISNVIPDGHGTQLNKILGVRDLTAMGIAAVIGAGVFSTIGQAAFNGGPGVSLLFVITAITCGFSALCYAEFASRVPVSGSAYTYSYVVFGEIIAWIIGWALILEYAIGNIVVAISWSTYFNNLLVHIFNIHLPDWMLIDTTTARDAFNEATKFMAAGDFSNLLMLRNMNLLSMPGTMLRSLEVITYSLIFLLLLLWALSPGLHTSV